MLKKHIVNIVFAVGCFSSISAVFACDPAAPNPKNLLTNRSVAVLKGNILHAPTKTDRYHVIVHVTQTLRGNIKLGKYELAEGGTLGSRCEYAEMSVSYPSNANDGMNLKTEKAQYFFVNEKKGNTLIVPIGLGYGLPEINGFVVSRHFHEKISVKKFTDYLGSNAKNNAAPTWIVVKK
jgi:hypothetical protein